MEEIIIKKGYNINNLKEIEEITDEDRGKNKRYIGINWPVLYLMYNDKKNIVYVGQSTNVHRRMKEHNRKKIVKDKKIRNILIIYSRIANLSMAVNLENYLIRALGAEGSNKVINDNEGSWHEYYKTKEYDIYYESCIKKIWEFLIKEGLVSKNIEEVKKSELYKLSPFIELNKNQNNVITSVRDRIIFSEDNKNTIISGIPGTGKTILALYLSKDLMNYYKRIHKKIKIAIVTPVNQFNEVLKKTIKNIYLFNDIKVYNPIEAVNEYINSNEKFDILIVDEAHRLKYCANNNRTKKCYENASNQLNLLKDKKLEDINQLDWIEEISKKVVLFFDELQAIREDDLKKKDLERITEIKVGNKEQSNYFILKEPMRIKVENYIDYIDNILQIYGVKKKFDKIDFSSQYELYMTKDLRELEDILKKKNNSRLVAGYAWKWKTKGKDNYEKYFDFEEYFYDGEYHRKCDEKNTYEKEADFKKKWNKSTAKGWCDTEAAKKLEEIGCIHTIQGFDVDYIGVIFGREIIYRNGKIQVNRKEYKDTGGFNNKMLDEELVKYIKKIYRVLMSRGMRGTYIYVFDKKLREYLNKYIDYCNYGKEDCNE